MDTQRSLTSLNCANLLVVCIMLVLLGALPMSTPDGASGAGQVVAADQDDESLYAWIPKGADRYERLLEFLKSVQRDPRTGEWIELDVAERWKVVFSIEQLAGNGQTQALRQLVELLDFDRSYISQTPLELGFPAVAAVVSFGEPAIPMILEAVATGKRPVLFRIAAWSTLCQIVGGPDAARRHVADYERRHPALAPHVRRILPEERVKEIVKNRPEPAPVATQASTTSTVQPTQREAPVAPLPSTGAGTPQPPADPTANFWRDAGLLCIVCVGFFLVATFSRRRRT